MSVLYVSDYILRLFALFLSYLCFVSFHQTCVPWSKRVANLHAYRGLIDKLSVWLRQIVGPLFHLGRPTYAAVCSSPQFLLSVVNCDPKIFNGNCRNKQVHQQCVSLKCARHSEARDEIARRPAQDMTHALSSVSMLDTLPVCRSLGGRLGFQYPSAWVQATLILLTGTFT